MKVPLMSSTFIISLWDKQTDHDIKAGRGKTRVSQAPATIISHLIIPEYNYGPGYIMLRSEDSVSCECP